MINRIISKRRLKPFKQFLPGCFRGTREREAFGKKLTEETLDSAITGASAMVIDSTSTDHGGHDRECAAAGRPQASAAGISAGRHY